MRPVVSAAVLFCAGVCSSAGPVVRSGDPLPWWPVAPAYIAGSPTASPTTSSGPLIVWSFRTGCAVVGTPALWDGLVYLTSSDRGPDVSHVDAVCATSGCDDGIGRGQLAWHFGTGAAPLEPLSSGSPVVWQAPGSPWAVLLTIGGNPATLYALNATETMRAEFYPLWTWQPTGWDRELLTPALGDDDTVYVTSIGSPSQLAAVRMYPGYPSTSVGEVWAVSLGTSATAPSLSPSRQLVYVASTNESEPGIVLRALNSFDGSSTWATRISGSSGDLLSPSSHHRHSAPVASPGRVFVSFSARTDGGGTSLWVASFDADANGVERWRVPVGNGSRVTVSGVVDGGSGLGETGRVVLVSSNATPGGSIWALSDVSNGKPLWVATPSEEPVGNVSCSAPLFAEPFVFVTCATVDAQWVWAGFAASGSTLWRMPLPFAHYDMPLSCGGKPCGGCWGLRGQWNCPPAAPSVDRSQGMLMVPGTDGVVHAVRCGRSPSPPAVPGTATETLLPPEAGQGSHDFPEVTVVLLIAGGLSLLAVILVYPAVSYARRDPAGGSAAAALTSPPAGDADRYQVLRRLGSGAFGVVYLVRRKKDGVRFAMKYIACESHEDRQEALHEWQTISSLQQGHPNMIRVFETFTNCLGFGCDLAGESDDEPCAVSAADDSAINDCPVAPTYVCIVMPYYPEGDLKHFIQSHQDRAVPEATILSYGGQIASLLSVLHSRSPPLIHRDLKPQNVLLSDSGRTVVVTDFGLARKVDDAYCRTHAGTFAFIAPELWERRYSMEVDIWGLGCILYAMATRRVDKERLRVLWREANEQGFQEQVAKELADEGYGAELCGLVAMLLAPLPQNRPTAQQVVDMLGSHTPQPSRRASAQGIGRRSVDSLNTCFSHCPSPLLGERSPHLRPSSFPSPRLLIPRSPVLSPTLAPCRAPFSSAAPFSSPVPVPHACGTGGGAFGGPAAVWKGLRMPLGESDVTAEKSPLLKPGRPRSPVLLSSSPHGRLLSSSPQARSPRLCPKLRPPSPFYYSSATLAAPSVPHNSNDSPADPCAFMS
eukprot:TRINITY_DN7170_c0_g1_i1.p1 TRINITY_DN7170_c0_g1~~TRINITY_DN7170_c0_g1_i1.p1  ORF type:complete len:1048 (+),score=301.38 TRINITY_DN7170_c0_g1_i1:554-3697(+)